MLRVIFKRYIGSAQLAFQLSVSTWYSFTAAVADPEEMPTRKKVCLKSRMKITTRRLHVKAIKLDVTAGRRRKKDSSPQSDLVTTNRFFVARRRARSLVARAARAIWEWYLRADARELLSNLDATR